MQRPPDVVGPNELGIGDEADTRANANRLIPRPVPMDYSKYMDLGGKVLRFTACLVSAAGCPLLTHFDKERR